jgi:katanin p60 ATPase-containing subunit A1
MDGISNSNAAESEKSGTGADDDGGDGGDDDDDSKPAAKMVMVLGATNQPWELDDAFKRRFEKRIYIPLPGPVERVALFRICLRTIRLGADVDLDALARLTDHYSGADIAVVCKHAAYAPMRHKQAEVGRAFPRPDQIRDRIMAIKAAEEEVKTAPIARADFEEAVGANKPSASVSNLKRFDDYAAEHGAT